MKNEKLEHAIKEICKKNNLPLYKLAAKIDLSESHLFKILNYKRNPPRDFYLRFFRAFDLTQEEKNEIYYGYCDSLKFVKVQTEDLPTHKKELAMMFSICLNFLDEKQVALIRKTLQECVEGIE